MAFTLLGQPAMQHRLRQLAGNAVAEGYPYEDAIAAVTRAQSTISAINAG